MFYRFTRPNESFTPEVNESFTPPEVNDINCCSGLLEAPIYGDLKTKCAHTRGNPNDPNSDIYCVGKMIADLTNKPIPGYCLTNYDTDSCRNFCSGNDTQCSLLNVFPNHPASIPPPKTYDNVNGTCQEFKGGRFTFLQNCIDTNPPPVSCPKGYVLKDGCVQCSSDSIVIGNNCQQCQSDEYPNSDKTECIKRDPVPPPPPKPSPTDKYSCRNGSCLPDPDGTNLDICKASCNLPPKPSPTDKYSCKNGDCVSDPAGTSLDDCKATCNLPPQPKPSPTDKYSCRNGVCLLNTDPNNGLSLDDCKASCKPPDPPNPIPSDGDTISNTTIGLIVGGIVVFLAIVVGIGLFLNNKKK